MKFVFEIDGGLKSHEVLFINSAKNWEREASISPSSFHGQLSDY